MNDIKRESLKRQLNYWYARICKNEANEYVKGYYRGICKSIELMGFEWERNESGNHFIYKN